jgi:hypothetical protein
VFFVCGQQDDPAERAVHTRVGRARVVLMWTLWLGSAVCGIAHAQQERPALAHLDWHAPPAAGCIPARELEREVEALLDRPVFTARSRADHVLSGEIQNRGDDWVAVLRLQTRTGAVSGTREVLVSGACARLNRPLVIVIATLLDTQTTESADDPLARLGLGLNLDGDLGTLPNASAGANVLAELTPSPTWPRLRLQLGGRLPQRETNAGIGANFMVFRGALAVCPALLAGQALALALCAGVEAGAMRAQALGLTPSRSPTRMLAAVPLELELSWQLLSRLALRLGLGFSLALLRPAFYFEDEGRQTHVVHHVPVWSATAHFGFIVDVL